MAGLVFRRQHSGIPHASVASSRDVGLKPGRFKSGMKLKPGIRHPQASRIAWPPDTEKPIRPSQFSVTPDILTRRTALYSPQLRTPVQARRKTGYTKQSTLTGGVT